MEIMTKTVTERHRPAYIDRLEPLQNNMDKLARLE